MLKMLAMSSFLKLYIFQAEQQQLLHNSVNGLDLLGYYFSFQFARFFVQIPSEF
jgi:hypothetical protein